MRDAIYNNEIELNADGKYWGTLCIRDGRLLLNCRRRGYRVEFDLLASVEQRRAVHARVVRVFATTQKTND